MNKMVDTKCEHGHVDELHLQQTTSTEMECLEILLKYDLYNDMDQGMKPILKLQNILISKKLHSMKSTTLDMFLQ